MTGASRGAWAPAAQGGLYGRYALTVRVSAARSPRPNRGEFRAVWKTVAVIAGGVCCLTVVLLVLAGGVAFKAFGGFRPRGEDPGR
jgi:hypothetical protein